MLAALAVVLALAGAPASTQIDCNPALPATVELGLTVSDIAQVVDGRVVPGRLDHIELGTTACAAILYASSTPQERAALRRANPNIDFDNTLGVGLQVALHEANHVALDSPDECQVEKRTRSEVNELFARYADPGHIAQVEQRATTSDAALPAAYHGC